VTDESVDGTMADVDHEHPHGSEARERAFERGNEQRDDEERGDTV